MDEILVNAGRLISDARLLQDAGRLRSAGSLAAIGIEQLGAFIEAIAAQNNPNATIRTGMFGGRPNAHARRQDTVATQVSGYLLAEIGIHRMLDHWIKEHDPKDVTPQAAMDWLQSDMPKPTIEFSPEETGFVDKVSRLIRSGRLKEIREHGFYDDATLLGLYDAEILELINTAEELHSVVSRSAKILPFDLVARGGK